MAPNEIREQLAGLLLQPYFDRILGFWGVSNRCMHALVLEGYIEWYVRESWNELRLTPKGEEFLKGD